MATAQATLLGGKSSGWGYDIKDCTLHTHHRSIWTYCIAPNGTGEIGTGEIGTGEIGTGEIGTVEKGTTEIGTGEREAMRLACCTSEAVPAPPGKATTSTEA